MTRAMTRARGSELRKAPVELAGAARAEAIPEGAILAGATRAEGVIRAAATPGARGAEAVIPAAVVEGPMEDEDMGGRTSKTIRRCSHSFVQRIR